MTLQPTDLGQIPEETIKVAKAAFPKGNAYLKLRDELRSIYVDEDFEDLFPKRGQPAESPGRLALVTILQFAENLSDRQAADVVRSRIDRFLAQSGISGILKESCIKNASEPSGKSQEIGKDDRQLLCHAAPGGRPPPG